MTAAKVIGLDIGGAYLKAADPSGRSSVLAFPLWKSPERLDGAIREVLAPLGEAESYAVTMTGELADCFADRGEGVTKIVDAARRVMGDRARFYSVDGKWLTAEEAIADDALVAASNWHAMATLAARMCDEAAVGSSDDSFCGEGLLIDIGSTTSDLIPLIGGRVATSSRSDYDRLCRGELHYVGIGRTPVCAVVDSLPYRGDCVPIMNEVFATTDDCALLLGLTTSDASDTRTCDGRPRTIAAASGRMARMIGLDHRHVTPEDAAIMAAVVLERIGDRLLLAAHILSSPGAMWILAGHGSGLLEVPPDRLCLDLGAMLGPEISRVGPAYAVACLAVS